MSDRIRKAFDRVHAEEELKARTRDFLHQRLGRSTKANGGFFKYGAAVCGLVLLLGLGGRHLYFTPVSYISIDVNPSLEFGLNRVDRVISVTPYNQDGIGLVEDLELKNLRYDDAIVTLLGSREMSQYLTPDAQINILVVAPSQDKNARIQEQVMERTGDRYGAVSCHAGSGEEMQKAHHAGLSYGKYRAIQELKALDPSIKVEDVQDLSMSRIQEMIREYTGETGADMGGCEDGGWGRQGHGGKGHGH